MRKRLALFLFVALVSCRSVEVRATQISDNFVRANGALGSNWATPVPNHAEFATWSGTAAGSLLINSNGVGPDATNGLDAAVIWNGAQSFGNDQWAAATIKTVASPTAVLSITAASQSGSNTTYTYTVTSGDAATPISGGALYVIITGMADAGNNGHFTATTFGAGTFTVANASGVTRSGQSGVGNCPSDAGVGVGVRMSGSSAATLTGYFFHVGTNSYGGGGRKYYYELWKVVNGAGTDFMHCGDLALSTTAPVAGDTIGISVVGTTVTAYYNGAILTGGALGNGVYQVTDSTISSGKPGMWSFAVSGASEYLWTTWSNGTGIQYGGNNGTTVNNFNAGDISSVSTQLASENFKETGTYGTAYTASGSGDLHTADANWVYQGSSTFTVSSGVVYDNHSGNNYAYRSDVSAPTNDQWAEEIVKATVVAGTQNNGPCVRLSASAQTGYCLQIATTLNRLTLFNAGGTTTLGTVSSGTATTGDSFRVTVKGTTLNVYKNGFLVLGPITDSTISTGNVGVFSAGNTTSNGFSKFAGGSLTELTTATNFVQDSNQGTGLDPNNGAFSALTDNSAANGHVQIYENTINWPNDQYVQGTLTVAPAVNDIGGFWGPFARTSFSQTGYLFTPYTHLLVGMYRLISGTATLFGTATYTTVANDVFRIEVQGEYIACKVNGTTKVSFIDNSGSLVTSGKPGALWANGSGGGASGLKPLLTLTSWSAGSLGSSSTQVGGFVVGP